jgi:hypothetical protein
MYPKRFKPLIIVGRQRAGTRFLTNLLNSFDEVSIQGEIPTHVMNLVVRFVRETDTYYAMAAERGIRHARAYNIWLKKKEELLFSIWEFASQVRSVPTSPKTCYFGYKRPNNERYFDFYEEAFAFRPPVYVYCVRNFPDNFLSVVSRWPERRIKDIAKEYMDSIAQYHRMKGAASDRVLLFNLDNHVKYGIDHVETSVIHPLGLKLTVAHREKLERMKARNRTEGDLKIHRRTELTAKEQKFLDRHPELDIAFRRLC